MRVCGNLQHLSRLDLVRIAEDVPVRVEDLRVGVRVAERLLRDLAQRVARLDGVGLLTLRSGLTLLRSRWRAGRADVSHNLLLPGRDRLDRVPDLVGFLLRPDGPLEVKLAVVFFRVALE